MPVLHDNEVTAMKF